MIDKLLPLIKEHFDEENWTLTVHSEQDIEHIYIEDESEYTEISITYYIPEDQLWIGGEDIHYDTYRLIHDIIEEAKHDIKTVRCQECDAIIDTPDNKYRYYIGMEYHCKACNNTGFIRTEDIWTTTE